MDGRNHRRRHRRPAGRLRARRRRAADDQPAGVGARRAGAGRHRPAHGLRPALPAVPAPAVARPAPPHHDQHRRRGLPRRRRRLLDREPGHERHLPAADVGDDARGDVRDPREAGPHGRAAVAERRPVPVHRPALLRHDAVGARGAGQGARVEADLSASTRSSRRSAWSRASRASRTRPPATPRRARRRCMARIAITWQQSVFGWSSAPSPCSARRSC